MLMRGFWVAYALVAGCSCESDPAPLADAGEPRSDAGRDAGSSGSDGGSDSGIDAGPILSDGGADAGALPMLTGLAADVEAAFIRAACQAYAECVGDDESSQLAAALVRAASRPCEEWLRGTMQDVRATASRIAAAVDSGAVRFDADALDACLDGAIATCDFESIIEATVETIVEPACARVLEGTLAAGAGCPRFGCASGLGCATVSFADHCGVCEAALVPIGDECGFRAICEPAGALGVSQCIYPDAGVTTTRCIELRARTDLALGEPCDLVDRTGNVLTLGYCAAGLYCRTDRPDLRRYQRTGVCAAPAGAGESCSDAVYCAPGAVCFAPRCFALSVHSTVGESCEPRSSIPCDPTAALVCRDGACEVLGPGGNGAPCESAGHCLPYHACVPPGGVDPICVEPFPDGAACERDRDCVSSICEAGVCGAPSCE